MFCLSVVGCVHSDTTRWPPAPLFPTTSNTNHKKNETKQTSYALHVVLPTKVDPLVSLMKVEKVPDSTYDMIGGLDQQVGVFLGV